MATPKRDPKTGRFLKRSGKGVVNRRTRKARKNAGGLKGHKPGCRCVIHARKAGRSKSKLTGYRITARRPRAGHKARSTVRCAIKLTRQEAHSYRKGAVGLRVKVKRRAQALIRQHGGAVRVQSPSGKTLAILR